MGFNILVYHSKVYDKYIVKISKRYNNHSQNGGHPYYFV